MKAPEQFDPSKPDSQTNVAPVQQSSSSKSPALAKGTPTITQTHKQTAQADKKAFQWQFLLPKYWGIWLLMALVMPMIYLPLRWQFWLGRKLGIFIYKVAGSRRRDT